MIMWPKAKRAVTDAVAAEIAQAARRHGAQPVGVFVDEDAATITARCAAAGLGVAQLHGDAARAVAGQLPPELQVNTWRGSARPACASRGWYSNWELQGGCIDAPEAAEHMQRLLAVALWYCLGAVMSLM